MVDVLADVVLIEPHRAIRREGQVLYISQIDGSLCFAHVFQPYMPEPGSRSSCEHERNCVVDALPVTDANQISRGVLVKPGTADRPDEGSRFDGWYAFAQIQIRRATLDLIADEQRQRDLPVLEAPQRSVSVDFGAQTGGVREQFTHGRRSGRKRAHV